MHVKRITRHLLLSHGRVRKAFPAEVMQTIEHAIQSSEAQHQGEIRFAVEESLHTRALFAGLSARDRAIEVFSQLRVWDTEHNNGVLVYLLLADRAVEIVADRGVHAKLGSAQWQSICAQMQAAFALGNYADGVVSGIRGIALHMRQHFPSDGPRLNELSDTPVVVS